MADSTASIRSIYSGKGDFSDGDFEMASAYSQVPLATGELSSSNNAPPNLGSESRKFHENGQGIGPSPGPSPVSGFTDPMSYHYRDGSSTKPGFSSNLPNLAVRDFSPVKLTSASLVPGPPDWPENQFPHTSSTNVSMASSISECHSAPKSGADVDYSETEFWQTESSSRPLSRNSTTSGFSTTATKDGIEGKRPYRIVQRSALGHTVLGKPYPGFPPYSNSPYSNSGGYSPGISPQGTFSGPGTAVTGLRHEIAAAALPPVSLDEKIDLMNREGGPEK